MAGINKNIQLQKKVNLLVNSLHSSIEQRNIVEKNLDETISMQDHFRNSTR